MIANLMPLNAYAEVANALGVGDVTAAVAAEPSEAEETDVTDTDTDVDTTEANVSESDVSEATQSESFATALLAAPSATSKSYGVGDVVALTIEVGGTDVACTYKVTAVNADGTYDVQVGDGNGVAIDISDAGALSIPANVTDSGGRTFNITSLSDECFSFCTKLTDIHFAADSSVKSLGRACFDGCTSLTDTGLGTNSTVTSLGDACFYGCTNLTDTGLGTNLTVPTMTRLCH